MDKLGIAVEVNKSGSEKDIGTPFVHPPPKEQKIMQEVTDDLAEGSSILSRAIDGVGPEDLAGRSASARIDLAAEALQLSL